MGCDECGTSGIFPIFLRGENPAVHGGFESDNAATPHALLVERSNRLPVNLYNNVGFAVVDEDRYDVEMALTL